MYIPVIAIIIFVLWWSYRSNSKEVDAKRDKQAKEDAALLHRMYLSSNAEFSSNYVAEPKDKAEK